jgi:hypothetical protein
MVWVREHLKTIHRMVYEVGNPQRSITNAFDEGIDKECGDKQN